MSPVFRRACGRPVAPYGPRLAAATVATLLAGSSAVAQAGAERRTREPSSRRVAVSTAQVPGDFGKATVHAMSTDARFSLESGPVDFGEVLSGEAKEMPGGIRARVYAEGEWTLALVPRMPLRLVNGRTNSAVPGARLAWRSPLSGSFEPFHEGQPAVVARGSATGPGGQLVVVDLRMALGELDDIGWYEGRFDLRLDTSSLRGLPPRDRTH